MALQGCTYSTEGQQRGIQKPMEMQGRTHGGPPSAVALRTVTGSRNHSLTYRGDRSVSITPHQASSVPKPRAFISYSKKSSQTHIHTHTHTHTYTLIHTTHTHTLIHTHTHSYTHTHIHTHSYTHTHTAIHITHIHKYGFPNTQSTSALCTHVTLKPAHTRYFQL